MSLAPIEAGALRQNKLTDHFFVSPTDRRFWDKVHKSRSFGFPLGFEGPSTSLKFHILGSWKFCLGGFEGFLYPEVSRWTCVRAIMDHQFSSEITSHHCDSGDMFWAQQHRRGWTLFNISPTGLSSRGARPLLWMSTMESGPGWPGLVEVWLVGGTGSGAMSPSKLTSLDSGSLWWGNVGSSCSARLGLLGAWEGVVVTAAVRSSTSWAPARSDLGRRVAGGGCGARAGGSLGRWGSVGRRSGSILGSCSLGGGSGGGRSCSSSAGSSSSEELAEGRSPASLPPPVPASCAGAGCSRRRRPRSSPCWSSSAPQHWGWSPSTSRSPDRSASPCFALVCSSEPSSEDLPSPWLCNLSLLGRQSFSLPPFWLWKTKNIAKN